MRVLRLGRKVVRQCGAEVEDAAAIDADNQASQTREVSEALADTGSAIVDATAAHMALVDVEA
jgi:predicted translin family RNA/ssDNA-binding protein